MDNTLKIILSGLDYAGKSSILTALDKKFDFEKYIMELKPTIKVEYNKRKFLDFNIYIWDMGGQEKYRALYEKNRDAYFSDTNLVLFIIDIQDKERFEMSLGYLDMILKYFDENSMDVPLIVSFHKFDPELRGNEVINENITELRELIFKKYPKVKILFQQTSIYDIISIVQLISYALSVFDPKFFELSHLLESYLEKFNCSSLILFDENGIIISEFYSEEIDPDSYIVLLESIKEHLYLLKRMQEEKYDSDYNFTTIENNILSYLHKISIGKDNFYVSVLVKEESKESLLDNFSDFINELGNITKELL
ncbi:MAG: ADP-ribosylation factor-like protein [Promethearchaeota archaeon]